MNDDNRLVLKKKRDSKTIKYNLLWFTVATTMLGVFADNQALIAEYVPPWAYLIVIMFNSGVGVYLRTITVDAIEPFKKLKDSNKG